MARHQARKDWFADIRASPPNRAVLSRSALASEREDDDGATTQAHRSQWWRRRSEETVAAAAQSRFSTKKAMNTAGVSFTPEKDLDIWLAHEQIEQLSRQPDQDPSISGWPPTRPSISGCIRTDHDDQA